ncbi:ATP-binding protein [Peterkaempfera bronchialis]|uniref:ATP-binding protein n=1 Tax=Peterkaempfera bronchialis TaxID=2126346 RepID=A0A345T581_9ACTN|nr:ATP-binding protein [Peterkaempfera bronchialis]
MRLAAVPSRFETVRRITSAHLRYWKCAPLVDSALLGLTELLANVHQHAAGSEECVLELRAAPDCLTISVHDADPTLPVAREADVWEVSGRGLAIVAALSKEWGAVVEPEGLLAGKVVWFSLAADPVLPDPLRAPRARRALAHPRLTVDPLRPSAPLRTAPLVLPSGDEDDWYDPALPGRAQPVAVPHR